MLKSTTGATIIVNDTGIYIQNGKGASIVMAGPTVTINAGALGGDLMPGFLLHVGATVTVQPRRPGAADRAQSARRRSWASPPSRITAPYVVAGCAFPPPPAANGPCVTAQFLTGSVRVTSIGQPLLLLASQAICAPTGTPLIITVTQTRVVGI